MNTLVVLTLLLSSPTFFGQNFTSASGYSVTVLADTPVVYYRLAEASGTSATDTSGNSHTGTYTGAGITYSVAGGVTGNNAVTFASASSASMDSGVNGTCNPGSADFSVECWAKTSTSGSITIMVGKVNGGSDSYWLGVDASGHAEFSVANSENSLGANAISAGTVNNNAWHYIVGVKDGLTIRMYVDGSADGTAVWSGTATCNPGGNLTVARFGALTFYFNGSIDEACYYASKLSAARITAHWNARTAP